MTTVILFVLAAGIGATVRHLVRSGVGRFEPIPVGTFLVNLAGSFLLGVLAGWDPPGATIVGTAGIGALTTFSTFSADVLELRAEGRAWTVAYAGATLVGGIALAWLGLRLS